MYKREVCFFPSCCYLVDNVWLQVQDDVEAEMRRLKLELKQTMEMYSTACKEALTAQQKVGNTIPIFVHEDLDTQIDLW